MRLPKLSMRRTLQAMAERNAQKCVKCHKVIKGQAVWDVDPKTKARIGPMHPSCAPAFRERIEIK